LFPSREVYDSKKIDSIDGQIVEVTHKIINGKKSGRVLLNGTEWNATTSGHEIERGEYVKILTRNNLTLVVEKVSHSELEKFLNANKKPSEDDYP
jgi:membrane-bound ClpP family serine protease